MIAAFAPGSDIKRYFRGRMPRLAITVIMLMPLLYGAMYLWAFWNPFANADRIPVALVNEDTGASVDGRPLQAGEEVAARLVEKKPLDLHEVSASEAAEGVASGKYYFSITLPADFSESIASPTSKSPRSADLIFTYNDANNYLATLIGQDAAQQIVNEVGAEVGAQTFDIVLNDVGSISGQLQKAADGANELATGLVTADNGAHELSTNLVTAKDGAAQLAGGIDELSGAVTRATDPVLTALGSVSSAGLSPAEITAIADRIGANAAAVTARLNTLAADQAAADQALSQVITALRANPDPVVQQLATTLAPAEQFLSEQALGPQASGQLTQVRSDVSTLSTALNDPQGGLRSALSLLGSGGLGAEITTLRNAVTELDSGSNRLSSGLVELSDGAAQLAAGTTRLSSGANELASGLENGVKAIPSWDAEQKKKLADTLARPVALDEDTDNPASTFGTGFTPFFLSLALFVGGIITWMLLTPLQSRAIVRGIPALRVVLASFSPAFFIGFVQAAVLYTVITFAVGLDAKYPVATFGFLLLVVAAFIAIIQMFNAVFGIAVGRAVTLAFLMLQLVSAGGIYPVPTTPEPFQYLHHVDPMTYTVNGLRQLTVGGIDSRLWTAIAVLAGIVVVSMLLSSWAARRDRQYTMDRLYPPVEL
ncbi:YhgE/Pip domain-containing protein [Gordonia sp. zg691]|uniref:YhgE/Pip family protein n=1 Tax=Gordonia jinghuaiqii TaxID=2758710 RepID=UPI00166222C7|nr:YhgE/Pip domain-containing protein [Gordonia jinghuaiqii]MBD0863429.1 YhgE/Pip domain-containing protein [Gordonia jinghuaiqii]